MSDTLKPTVSSTTPAETKEDEIVQPKEGGPVAPNVVSSFPTTSAETKEDNKVQPEEAYDGISRYVASYFQERDAEVWPRVAQDTGQFHSIHKHVFRVTKVTSKYDSPLFHSNIVIRMLLLLLLLYRSRLARFRGSF